MRPLYPYSLWFAFPVLIAACATTPSHHNDFWRESRGISPQGQAYAHYLAGILYEMQGNAESALTEMERVAALDKQGFTPILRLIRLNLRLGKNEEALLQCEKAIERDPKNANLYILRGKILQDLQRYEAAAESFLKAIELDPNNMLGYGALVVLQQATNDLVSAIQVYEKLLELSPNAPGLHYQLALQLIRIKDYPGARQALEKAIALDPNNVQAHLLSALVALEQNDPDRAVAFAQYYVQRRPMDLEGLRVLAAALARKGQTGEAVKVMERLLQRPELEAADRRKAAFLALIAEEWDRVVEWLGPEAEAGIFPRLFVAAARHAQGLDTRELLQRLPNAFDLLDKECNDDLASLAGLFGPTLVENTFRQRVFTLPIPPEQTLTFQLLEARLDLLLKKYADAVAVLTQALNAAPEEPFVHRYLAYAYQELKQFAQTEEHVKKALEKNPDDDELLNFLGYLYAEHGVKLDEAERLIQRALILSPKNPYYLDSLGWVYYQRGDAKRAVELIQEAIYLMDTDDPILREHLGDAYLLLGDTQRAIKEWERALRLDRTLDSVRQKIEKHRPASS
jgi:tetratricopeptide (TPR) repeat protein